MDRSFCLNILLRNPKQSSFLLCSDPAEGNYGITPRSYCRSKSIVCVGPIVELCVKWYSRGSRRTLLECEGGLLSFGLGEVAINDLSHRLQIDMVDGEFAGLGSTGRRRYWGRPSWNCIARQFICTYFVRLIAMRTTSRTKCLHTVARVEPRRSWSRTSRVSKGSATVWRNSLAGRYL